MQEGNAEIRERLELLIRQSGESYAAISRLIGRNAAYVQQFIRRGVPRRLSEQDRRRLALHFHVSEQYLGGQSAAPPVQARRIGACTITPEDGNHSVHESQSISVIVIPYLECSQEHVAAASMAAGGFVLEACIGHRISDGRPANLGALVAQGDSMEPTVHRGDILLYDGANRRADRDGLYVLQGPRVPMVRRIAIDAVEGKASILADNPAYPPSLGCEPDVIPVIGRILWIGKAIG